jgi:hypothetical protein
MNDKVDVLAVMDEAERVLRMDRYQAIPDDLIEARAAVAELIEVAEQIEKKSVTSTVFLSDFERLSAALARVKGE